MRILLSGGGTAGHVYPALTVAERLRDGARDTVAFVGTARGLEARLAREAGIEFIALPARGFDRSRPWTLLTAATTAAASAFAARSLIRGFRPDVVAGFGGYVALPLGLAARLSGVRLVLHEQNSVPGLANRVLSRWADAVGVTYPASIPLLRHPARAVLTGNPVRASVLRSDRDRGRRTLGLSDDALVLLVFGGSRGARHINEAATRLAPRLVEQTGVRVVHVAGRAEAADVRRALGGLAEGDDPPVRVYDYLDEMGDAIAAADLVLARAGATSIAEITAIGRASLLVPYPYATDDHQTGNARVLEEARAALVVADAELDSDGFGETLLGLLRDERRRAEMAASARKLGLRDATARLAALIRGEHSGAIE